MSRIFFCHIRLMVSPVLWSLALLRLAWKKAKSKWARCFRGTRTPHVSFLIYLLCNSTFAFTNSSDSFTNLEFRIYEFFNKYLSWYQLANWGKKPTNFGSISTKFVLFFNWSNGEKLVRKIVENIWWIRYKCFYFLNMIFSFLRELACQFIVTFR